MSREFAADIAIDPAEIGLQLLEFALHPALLLGVVPSKYTRIARLSAPFLAFYNTSQHQKIIVYQYIENYSEQTIYDRLLETEDVDVLGNRLHGGIRALAKGRRALILEIDNRAREMARESNLPTVRRDDFARMAAWISGSPALNITMPWENIAVWKGQFQDWG